VKSILPRAQQPGLKPTHKLVQAYYAALAQFGQHYVTRETAVRQPFLDLLRAAASQRGWSLEPEFPMQGTRGHRVAADFTDPNNRVQVVNTFFAYTQPIHQKWDEAVADFQHQAEIPQHRL
jgi:hypothetical protein